LPCIVYCHRGPASRGAVLHPRRSEYARRPASSSSFIGASRPEPIPWIQPSLYVLMERSLCSRINRLVGSYG